MKFRFSDNFIVDSDQDPWRREGLRIAMLGGPGSGKSWNDSLIIEQFLSQGGTVIIFQPRDEYYTLKEKFDLLSVGGVHAKDIDFALTSPKAYAKAVVEDGISMIFYTSQLDEEKLVDWVARFIHYVLALQEVHKRPLLINLEEAHEYTPKSPSGHVAPPWVYNRMIKAFKDCSTQGRKLNIIQIVSSQRPQELNFTIRQLANLTFYGKFSDQDIGYVDKECLKYVRKQGIEVDASRLVSLSLGEWLVIQGKHTRFIKVTEQRLTKHGADTPALEYVAPRAAKTKKTISEFSQAITEALKKEESEKSELEKAKRKIRDLTKKLAAAVEQARIKLSVKELLQGGASDAELAEKLAGAKTEIEDLREQLKDAEQQVEDMNKEMLKLEASNKPLRESLKKFKEEAEQLGFEVKDLRRFKQIGEDADNLRQAFIKFLRLDDATQAGFEPGAAVPAFTIAEVDDRINQRLLGPEPVRVVTVNVSERIKELVKNDYVSRLVSKIQGLPEPARKAALWLHEKRQAKIGDLYFYMYEKTGRIPGNFYVNVMKPLENAWLIVNESGNVRWILQEKLAAELKDVLSDGDVQELAEYLKSLLLGG